MNIGRIVLFKLIMNPLGRHTLTHAFYFACAFRESPTCQVLLGGAGSDLHFAPTDTELDQVSTAGKLYLADRLLARGLCRA